MPRSKEAFDAMRENTRQKIDAAALSLFARKGLSVKVAEIAEAAGVSQGLMYSHYQSKDALIAELVRQATEISSRSVVGIASDMGAIPEKIRQISGMMCGLFLDVPVAIDYFMFMVQVGTSGFSLPEDLSYGREHPNPVETLAQIIVQGQAEGSVVPGDPVQLSMIYWAAIQGLCCYAITGMPVKPHPEALDRILLKEDYL